MRLLLYVNEIEPRATIRRVMKTIIKFGEKKKLGPCYSKLKIKNSNQIGKALKVLSLFEDSKVLLRLCNPSCSSVFYKLV